jgi:hypothetical protein
MLSTARIEAVLAMTAVPRLELAPVTAAGDISKTSWSHPAFWTGWIFVEFGNTIVGPFTRIAEARWGAVYNGLVLLFGVRLFVGVHRAVFASGHLILASTAIGG